MDMFKPEITLWTEPDGEYTIHATALVPLSGYVVAGVKPGVPPANVKLTAETFPILLLLKKHPSPGFQIPHLRTWQVSNQSLQGKTQVSAFVSLVHHRHEPETTLGHNSIPVSASFPLPDKTPVVLGSEWQAWLSEDKKTLHVQGSVQTPTPGFSVSLVPTNPQGINPKILMLDVVVQQLPGIWPQHVTAKSVSYEQPNHDYKNVQILEKNGHGAFISLDDQS